MMAIRVLLNLFIEFKKINLLKIRTALFATNISEKIMPLRNNIGRKRSLDRGGEK